MDGENLSTRRYVFAFTGKNPCAILTSLRSFTNYIFPVYGPKVISSATEHWSVKIKMGPHVVRMEEVRSAFKMLTGKRNERDF